MDINWYPGHMAKTRRSLEKQISQVDLIIELCDARLPLSSRNPDLDRMIRGRNRILIMTKADLADPAGSAGWLCHFRKEGLRVSLVQSNTIKSKDALKEIENATRSLVEAAALRGVRKTVRAMVVGVPNVKEHLYQQIEECAHCPDRGQTGGYPKQSMDSGFSLSGTAGYSRTSVAQAR